MTVAFVRILTCHPSIVCASTIGIAFIIIFPDIGTQVADVNVNTSVFLGIRIHTDSIRIPKSSYKDLNTNGALGRPKWWDSRLIAPDTANTKIETAPWNSTKISYNRGKDSRDSQLSLATTVSFVEYSPKPFLSIELPTHFAIQSLNISCIFVNNGPAITNRTHRKPSLPYITPLSFFPF